jgi:GTP-binding protein HflX
LQLSATDRESTRPLLQRVAERLKTRWEEAALVPAYAENGERLGAEAASGDGEDGASLWVDEPGPQKQVVGHSTM